MQSQDLAAAFAELSTPLIADAGLRWNIPVRFAPPGIVSLLPGKQRVAGRALPVRHYGSVDVFMEALDRAEPGDILVIDNGGRLDEGCLGDLIVLEMQAAHLAGIAIWGAHRDSDELLKIGFPVFSYGAFPSGPRRFSPIEQEVFESARFGEQLVTNADAVFGDADGVAFVDMKYAGDLIEAALSIQLLERRQAEQIVAGQSLRDQLRFDEYLQKRRQDPTLTLRQHLRAIGGELEE